MKITTKQIVYKEVDIANKWRVWIEMPNGDLQMLKFQEDPTITKIQAEINKIKEPTKEELITEIDRQIAKLEERKKMLSM